jgi:hypothetical protein
LSALGLLALFSIFVAVTVYIGNIYRALGTNSGAALYINTSVLLAALCFAGFYKLKRSL